MYYSEINKCDTNNGPGMRVSLWVSGCTLNCANCFNPATHDFKYGQVFNPDSMHELLDALGQPHIRGLSVLGGEPTDNIDGLIPILQAVKQAYPRKDVWMWSGRVITAVLRKQNGAKLLSFVDILVDGPFIEKLKDPSLQHRGSSNQRVIAIGGSVHMSALKEIRNEA